MLQKIRNRKGFTLVELMIVVAIIGILAAIAIPNFLQFRLKAKTSEAKSNLGAIRSTEVAYFAEWNFYVGNQTPTPDRRPRRQHRQGSLDTRHPLLDPRLRPRGCRCSTLRARRRTTSPSRRAGADHVRRRRPRRRQRALHVLRHRHHQRDSQGRRHLLD